jgi:uncharacterized protein (TIGR02246 family)
MSEAIPHAGEVVRSMCERYASAVNANDSVGYSKLFTQEAMRILPGSEPEYGPDQIRQGEQADYNVAKWSIRSTPIDALRIAEDWIYGIARVDAAASTACADGTKTSFQVTKAWLLQRQASGEWLIARQMWNLEKKRRGLSAFIEPSCGQRAGATMPRPFHFLPLCT